MNDFYQQGHFLSWFNQWEPLVATSVGIHRSLVARTSMCVWDIRFQMKSPTLSILAIGTLVSLVKLGTIFLIKW